MKMRSLGDIVNIKIPKSYVYDKYQGLTMEGEVTKINKKTDEVTVWVNKEKKYFLCVRILKK